MFHYYIDAFKHYFDFQGRTGRKAFWYFVLWNFIISFVLSWISKDLANVYSLIVLIPSLAIGVRRLHDIGKSGWWILLSLIPIIGWIWLIILYLQRSIDDKRNMVKSENLREERGERGGENETAEESSRDEGEA